MFYRFFTFIFLISFLGACQKDGGVVDEKFAYMVDSVQSWVDNESLPFAEVLITDKDGNVLVHTSRKGPDFEFQRDEIFPLASLTKPMTNLAALILISEGKLSFETPVKDYIPNADSSVMVKHLLSMSSGYNNTAGYDGWFKAPGKDFVLPRILRPGPRKPKDVYLYAEDNLYLIQEIVELISGMSLEDFWKERIWEPLGLTNTNSELPNEYFRTHPYFRQKGDIIYTIDIINEVGDSVSFVHPGNGVNSTLSDYSKFLLNWNTLVTPEVAKTATTQQNRGYGMGWKVYEKYELYGHASFLGAYAFRNERYCFLFFCPVVSGSQKNWHRDKWHKLITSSLFINELSDDELDFPPNVITLPNEMTSIPVTSDDMNGLYIGKSSFEALDGKELNLKRVGDQLAQMRNGKVLYHFVQLSENIFYPVSPDGKTYNRNSFLEYENGAFYLNETASTNGEKNRVIMFTKQSQ